MSEETEAEKNISEVWKFFYPNNLRLIVERDTKVCDKVGISLVPKSQKNIIDFLVRFPHPFYGPRRSMADMMNYLVPEDSSVCRYSPETINKYCRELARKGILSRIPEKHEYGDNLYIVDWVYNIPFDEFPELCKEVHSVLENSDQELCLEDLVEKTGKRKGQLVRAVQILWLQKRAQRVWKRELGVDVTHYRALPKVVESYQSGLNIIPFEKVV